MNNRTGPETIRTFVALSVPHAVAASIGEIQNTLKDRRFKVKWVATDNLHLTLKFLGPTRTDKIPSIAQALTDAVAGILPLTLSARALGVFPGIRNPRVIWVGLDGDLDALAQVHHAVDNHLALIGFPPEKRSFKAHLTVGRVKGALNPQLLLDVIQQFKEYRSAAFQVRQIELIKSDLKPNGPEYS